VLADTLRDEHDCDRRRDVHHGHAQPVRGLFPQRPGHCAGFVAAATSNAGEGSGFRARRPAYAWLRGPVG
jgi:hypothetical protein